LDANVVTSPEATNVAENGLTPQKSVLFQKYRNRSFEFTVPSNGRTTLTVYNTFGQEVATLFSGEAEAGKNNLVQFNTDGLAKGWYFSKLDFNDKVTFNKIQILK
jgi:hypothetical protein